MKSELGLTHIYCGDGKGKTTAAMGLVLRAIGCGFRVVIVQFLKDGNSSELIPLKSFSNVIIFSKKGIPGFTFNMSDEQMDIVRFNHNTNLKSAIKLCEDGKCDVLLLDEVIGAVNQNLIDYQLLYDFLTTRPDNIEVIMTGRSPSKDLISISDYVSEIKKIKHPYDNGIKARYGVEK